MRQLAEGTVAPALILAVCAVSARFSRHPAVHQQPMALAGDEYAAKARQLLSLEFDRPTISNVQALVILGLHEFGSSRGARAWMYAGIAIRMAISLGLNVEDEQRLASQSWVETEIRRRVFWATFIMGILSKFLELLIKIGFRRHPRLKHPTFCERKMFKFNYHVPIMNSLMRYLLRLRC